MNCIMQKGYFTFTFEFVSSKSLGGGGRNIIIFVSYYARCYGHVSFSFWEVHLVHISLLNMHKSLEIIQISWFEWLWAHAKKHA